MSDDTSGNLILIGGDPEVFLQDNKSGNIIPSCGLIGGTKGRGIKIDPSLDATWHEDNVTLEFNFPPLTRAEGFDVYVRQMMHTARVALAAKGLSPYAVPEYEFRPEQLRTAQAMTFGCQPDLCAYTPGQSRVCDPGAFKNHRFAAGHIHFSYPNHERIPNTAVVMLVDALVGLPSLFFDRQEKRRPHYGLAGLYRSKMYGIEYRTLSNFWLSDVSFDRNSRMYMAQAFLSLGSCIKDYPVELSNVFAKIPFKDVQETINTNDKDEAANLIRYITSLPGLGRTCLSIDFLLRALHISRSRRARRAVKLSMTEASQVMEMPPPSDNDDSDDETGEQAASAA